MKQETIILKETGKIQLVIKTNNLLYNFKDLPDYKNRFNEFKKLGRISDSCNFNDIMWGFLDKHGSVNNISFRVNKLKLNDVLKCLAIVLIERGLTVTTIASQFTLLQKILIKTACFSKNKIDEFENFIYESTDSTICRISSIVPSFLSYYPIDNIDDYEYALDGLSWDIAGTRKLPNYKSILTFDHIINEIILKNNVEKETLKYYPLFLWWKITSIIPMRPSEFLELEFNCCWKDENGRYWIKIPRNKVKQNSSISQIEKADVLETTQDIYDFISHYKSLLKPDLCSSYLISWKAYNQFTSIPSTSFILKKNPEIMRLGSICLLFEDFYKTQIADDNIIPLKPGDSRHLAFCNMILQGFNPIAIARMGGHTHLISQTHYYEHLDTYAESYIFTMSDKLRIINHLKTKNASGKYEAIKRSRLLGTYTASEIDSFLEIEKGYCTIKQMGCEEFSNCVVNCWSCAYHILDTTRYPEVQKELHATSDKLGHVIKEQVDLLKSIGKNMFYDFATEKSSFGGNIRIKATAEQLQSIMAQKIVLDSKLLDYLVEDD